LFYPDNRDRARRCQELIDDISGFLSSIREVEDQLRQKDEQYLPTIDAIMKKEGLKTFEELKQKAFSYMTDQQKATYEKMIKDAEDARILSDKIFGASMLTVAIIGSVGLAAKAIELATTGALTIGVRMIGIGVRTLVEDFSLGMRIIRNVSRVVGEFQEVAELSNLGKFCRVISKIAGFLTVVGIVFDGVMAIWAAVEGAKQRTELQKGIHDLNVSRLCIKMNQLQTHYITNYGGEVDVYLLIVNTQGKDSDSAKAIANAIGTGIKANIASVTFDSVYENLGQMDQQRNSWRNEDPNKEQLRTDVENQG